MKNQKKRYLIYQTTNLVNGKIYIGQHITSNIEDRYFGSGKLLHRAILKYGIENFEFKILFELQNECEMNLLEQCVVNKEFLKRDDVYNLCIGGEGNRLAYQYANLTPEQKQKAILKGQRTRKNWSAERKDMYKKQCRLNALKWYANHPGYFAGERNPMYGHIDSEETHKKRVLNHLGSRNSQYGKMWICNDLTKESIRIMKTDPIPKGWRKGRICKK